MIALIIFKLKHKINYLRWPAKIGILPGIKAKLQHTTLWDL